jgi:hypothetical protein
MLSSHSVLAGFQWVRVTDQDIHYFAKNFRTIRHILFYAWEYLDKDEDWTVSNCRLIYLW